MSKDYAFNITATEYDKQRSRLIFCYDAFYNAAIRLLSFDDQKPLRILDLGAGTGLLSAHVLASYPHAEMTLLDASEKMLSGAKERFAEQKKIHFKICDFSKTFPTGPFDTVISALSIHHLDDKNKQFLFSRIYKALCPGGIFVNADQVKGSTEKVQKKNYQLWCDSAFKLGADERELATANERMKIQDQLSTIEDQLVWLQKAGFTDVDCTYKNGWFAVFGGTKPERE